MSSHNVQRWSATLGVFYAVGRGGEVSVLPLTNLEHNPTFGNINMTWVQKKTAKVKEIEVFCHRDDYKLDWFFSVFCYLVTSRASQPVGHSFLYPQLNQKASSASNFLTEVFKNFDKHASTALKRGMPKGLQSKVPPSM